MSNSPSNVRKAVFPVAGLGTRFLPATKSTPKEMLPVVDKPLIQYAAEEAVSAGVDTLIFITSRMKHSISDHFDSIIELETHLKRGGKEELLRRYQETIPDDITKLYLPQGRPLGLGHAILCAQPIVNNEPFFVLLADDLILSPEGDTCLAQLHDAYLCTGATVIAVVPITDDDCQSHGVIEIADKVGGMFRLGGIVEKPHPKDAPSRWGVIGRYLLTPRIFDHLKRLPPGANGEVQLTDGIAALLQEEPVYAVPLRGKRFDCGTRFGYVKATLEVALNDPQLRKELIEVFPIIGQSA